jgi:hypothetical protein
LSKLFVPIIVVYSYCYVMYFYYYVLYVCSDLCLEICGIDRYRKVRTPTVSASKALGDGGPTKSCLLSALEIMKKAIISFVMSVCVCVRLRRTNRLPLEGFSWNLIFEHFSKICPDNSSWTRITGTLHEELCTLVTICRSVLLRLGSKFR